MKGLSLIFVFSLFLIIGCEEKNIPPTCEITSPSNDEIFYVGDLITVSVDAEDEDGIILEVRLYINDVGIASASTFPFNFEWDTKEVDDGNKIIKVTVKDDKGGSAQDEISIILNPIGEPPVAAFTADTTWVIIGESVQFIDQSTNEPTSWFWNFGDENTSTDQNPTHTYTKTGSYTVELTVANHFGFDFESKKHYIIVIESIEIETGTFTDARDGKTYKTVKIGTQTWMAENLAYLPSVVGSDTGSKTASYNYVYGYNGTSVSEAKATSNYQTYGVLYNWPAALNACPSGWHLPTDAEWKTLEMHLGMSQAEADGTGWRGTDEGGKLKEIGTTHWYSPNTGATNESGFTALPGGTRNSNGNFNYIGGNGGWWSATELGTYFAWYRVMTFNLSNVNRNNYYKEDGFSVRCLRD